jgi:hypothetical protein
MGITKTAVERFFKWDNHFNGMEENKDNIFNIEVSKAPLGHKKFTALLVFTLSLICFSFIYYSSSIMFARNPRRKK